MNFKDKNNISKILFHPSVILVSLGYLVDIFDLTLFSMVRVKSLTDLGLNAEQVASQGIYLINIQMAGTLVGGLLWGILADRYGRLRVLLGSILLYSIGNILNAFVYDIPSYALLRFISGIGLAGELGAGITLCLEMLPKETRGWGSTLIASIGVLGALFGMAVVEFFPWRTCYIIGGILGLALLLLRMGVEESSLFTQLKQSKEHSTHKWSLRLFMSLVSNSRRRTKFLASILLGVPTWYVAGILMTFTPEISKALGILDNPIPAQRAIGISYLGLGVGDLLSGAISQFWRSRKKTMALFLTFLILSITLLFTTTAGQSSTYYYLLCFLIGVGAGFWVLFLTMASEQFGTNLRGTVTTSVPNFVRASMIPMTLGLKALQENKWSSYLGAVQIIGVIVFALTILAWTTLEETFGKDLNYYEK